MLGHPLGSALLSLCLRRLGAMLPSLKDTPQAKEAEAAAAEVWRAVGEVKDIAAPVEPVRMEFRWGFNFSITLRYIPLFDA